MLALFCNRQTAKQKEGVYSEKNVMTIPIQPSTMMILFKFQIGINRVLQLWWISLCCFFLYYSRDYLEQEQVGFLRELFLLVTDSSLLFSTTSSLKYLVKVNIQTATCTRMMMMKIAVKKWHTTYIYPSLLWELQCFNL